MKTQIVSIVSSALLLCACGKVVPSDGTIAIIPKPTGTVTGEGVFTLSKSTPVVLTFEDAQLTDATEALNHIVTPIFGVPLSVEHAPEAASHAINIVQDTVMIAGEYTLSISPKMVKICAASAQGVFYAVQSLRQLIPLAAFTEKEVSGFELPVTEIIDKPALGYRGMMLDVCRHFFSVEQVKQTIDLLAMHKMNIFHWHLTDDQGWRIEIKKYPKLTEIGSMRKQTLVGHYPADNETAVYDSVPYGGFYTQEQIREVVAYAAQRFITVIPEIEFPGHAVAALASYPALGCTGEQYDVRQTWAIDDRVFCIGKESTFDFIEGVLAEVIELFPSEYIHIGGDECPTVMWEKCPACKARMKAEGLTRPRQLQNYATNRIEKFLNAHARRLIGWDEILEGEITPSATIMSWRGTKGGVEAAKRGNHAIMAPTDHCYFDYYQSQDTANEPLSIGGYLPLEKVYALEPYENLTAEETSFILGVQCNLWTEYIATYEQAQYMLLPRLSALAEVGWSLDRKEYEDYKLRLNHLVKLYDIYGYNYGKHALENK
ncbi:MAG: beta-N-acetylhexosaminidase [Alistipes sp.]